MQAQVTTVLQTISVRMTKQHFTFEKFVLEGWKYFNEAQSPAAIKQKNVPTLKHPNKAMLWIFFSKLLPSKSWPGNGLWTMRLGKQTAEIIHVNMIMIDCFRVFLKMGQLKESALFEWMLYATLFDIRRLKYFVMSFESIRVEIGLGFPVCGPVF